MRFAAGLVLFAASLGAVEPSIPDTRAGMVFHAWLEAFNSGDRARVVDYLSKFEPDHKGTEERLLSLRDQTGGFNLLRIEKSEPLHIEALMKEREGENFARLVLDVNDVNPPTVKQMALRRAPRPADQAGVPRLTFGDAIQGLDAQANELVAKDKFSGAVLVGRGGKIAFEKAYGFADREQHKKNTVDTQFRIGSMNKMFTAAAVLQLVGEGKVDLAAPVGKYLPDYPNRDVATKVTIRHLLTHTGGTGDIFTPEYDKRRLETRELTDYVKLYGSRGLEFEPGSKWEYSNYGFLLLGLVIEKVSGMSYYEYVRKYIFGPAGMHATDSLPESETVLMRSAGYMRSKGAWVNNADTLPWRGTSAGGGYATVADLFRFAEALLRGKLVKAELLDAMTSMQAGAGERGPGAGYGFGMMIAEEPQGKRFGHGGGAPGMNGELRVYPRTDTVVAVLANVDPPAASRLADYFDQRMPVD